MCIFVIRAMYNLYFFTFSECAVDDRDLNALDHLSSWVQKGLRDLKISSALFACRKCSDVAVVQFFATLIVAAQRDLKQTELVDIQLPLSLLIWDLEGEMVTSANKSVRYKK